MVSKVQKSIRKRKYRIKKVRRNFTTVFNFRVFIVFALTSITYFLCIKYDFRLNNDYNIISIAIVFPLVFSITSAFQKRQDALRYFSDLRSNLLAISDYFRSTPKIPIKSLKEINEIIKEISVKNAIYLSDQQNKDGIKALRKDLNQIQNKIIQYESFFGNAVKRGVIESKQEVSLCVENLSSLKKHSTPKSLRAYCLLFIYIYPFIYVPGILGLTSVETFTTNMFTFFLCILISFVLVELYNIQDFIENPFDNKGLDDIKINEYVIDDSEFEI